MTPDGPKTKHSLSRPIKLAEKGEEAVIARSGKRIATIPAPAVRTQRTYLDTNILLYCDDSAHSAKQRRTLELVKDQNKLFHFCSGTFAARTHPKASCQHQARFAPYHAPER
jgi:antitoxin (DNA-binding transcriptional repressor) of toxin-antitoxin stability system